MNRILPHPVLTVFLVILWLILQQSLSLGNILLGIAIGYGAGLATGLLGLEKPVLVKPWRILDLIIVVTVDIIRSNIAVAWIVLTQGDGLQSAGFLRLPLKLRSKAPLAFLSIIITATPGTVWLEFDEEAGELLLHILDLVDEDAWRDTILNRYERRLLEIFA